MLVNILWVLAIHVGMFMLLLFICYSDFIVSDVTNATKATSVTVVCASALIISVTVLIAVTSVGLPGVLDWGNGFPPLPLIPLECCCNNLHLRRVHRSDHSGLLCQLWNGSHTDGFFTSRVKPSFDILILVLWWLFSEFIFSHGHSLHQWGLNHMGLHCCNPLEHTHDRHMCFMVLVFGP